MGEAIKLPEPFGYVSDYKHAGIRIMSFQYVSYDYTHSLYHSTRGVYTADQLRAAVEADRAQRAPGGYSADQIAQAAMEAEIPDAKLESLLIALASTPVPEQQAPAPLLAKIAELERLLKLEERLSFRCQVAELEAEAIRLRGLLRDLVRTTAAHHQSPGDMPVQAAYVAARDAALEELRKD